MHESIEAFRDLDEEEQAERRRRVRVLILTGLGLNCEAATEAAFRMVGATPERLHLLDLLGEASGKPVRLADYPKHRNLFELSFGKRSAFELYDLKKDPDQLRNIAGNPEYAPALERLKKDLFSRLEASADPRLAGKGAALEAYPYSGGAPKRGVPRKKGRK